MLGSTLLASGLTIMKFISAALTCAAIVGTTQAGVISERSCRDTSGGYLKIGFEKFHGHNFETATKEKKFSELIVKRDGGYGELELTNRNTFYTANLEIGTPKQEVIVLIDTGSSDLWVMGSDNSYCSDSDDSDDDGTFISTTVGSASQTTSGTSSTATLDCSTYGTFNSSNSTSYKENSTSFSVTYADTSAASGPWGIDTINFGNFTLENASIGVANVSNASVGGILGVGLASTESTYSGAALSSTKQTPYEYENVPELMVSQGIIHKNAYSLFLNSIDADTGNILFGAVDHSKYSGQLYTVPILQMYKLYSQQTALGFDITVQGVGLTDGSTSKTVTTTPFPALLDSGTTLMYLPYTLSDLIATQIGATYSSSLDYYLMDCPSDNDPTQIVFDFGGVQINTNLTNYILQTSSNSNICVLGIVPLSSSLAIFGDVFLRDAYVVYDLADLEISIAQASFDDASEDIEVITSSVPSATRAPGYSSTWTSGVSITSGGNIFTLSSSGSTKASATNDALSKGAHTTGSIAGTSGASSITAVNSGSTTASITKTSTSTQKKNTGEKIVPTSFFLMISSFLCSIFL